MNFYPRSPCGERPIRERQIIPVKQFLSTLSLRRATESQQLSGHPTTDFYPRSPCGERRVSVCSVGFARLFLSTLSLRRATLPRFPPGSEFPISIHALLAESDCWARSRRQPSSNFYPRSPCGERRAGRGHVASRHQISIHALLAESDVRANIKIVGIL